MAVMKNERFPLLSSLANVLRIMGFCAAGLGVIVFLIGLIQLLAGSGTWGLVSLALGVLVGIAGVATTALSELIGVGFSIEDNGRKLLDVQEMRYGQRLEGGEEGEGLAS